MSPLAHGLATYTVISSVERITKKSLNRWEFLAMIFWGVLVDIDHFISISFILDLWPRLMERNGGRVGEAVSYPICWLHVLPGILLALICGLVCRYWIDYFRWYLPITSLFFHLLLDYIQRADYYFNPLYPLFKDTMDWWQGLVPPGTVFEFVFSGSIFMFLVFWKKGNSTT